MKRYRPASLAPFLLLSGLLLFGVAPAAQAFIVGIGSGSRTLYLRVGDPGAGINKVSVTVPAATLGNGTSLPMTVNATETRSEYDNYVFCNLPAQVYVGGYYRAGNSAGNGSLSANVSAPLTNTSGQTIPFSQITWTSSGNGDGATAQPFPAGAFTGAPQTLATFPVNTWRESCHTFSYANSNLVAAGTYAGQVTYTLSAP